MSGQAMDLLKEDLAENQTAIRINAIHRVGIVATLIGEEKVKKELLPLLESLINSEDDEVLFSIAKVLGDLYPNNTQHFESIIAILETLASFEETVVRNQAVESINKISSQLKTSQIASHVIPNVFSLANGKWFTNKVSAIKIMSFLYDKAAHHQETIRKKFLDLCHEETPMIRRACASQMEVFCEKMNYNTFVNEMFPEFERMVVDDQDKVRVICVTSLIKIGHKLPNEVNKNLLIPILIQMTRDKAWKVRTTLAENFENIAQSLGTEITENSLLNIFTTLLQDSEGEVRTAAVVSFTHFMKLISPTKLTSVLIQMVKLMRDTLPLVRVGATENLSYICQKVSTDALKNKVLPTLLKAMETEQDDEVKIELVKTLKNFGLAIGTEFFTLVPQIEIGKLMMENNWRIRKTTLEMITDLAIGFKAVELFEVHLQDFFFKYFEDKVHAVRMFGNTQLKKILEFETPKWVSVKLLPLIETYLKKQMTYLKRSTAVYALGVIASSSIKGKSKKKAVELLCECAQDTVSNVRMIVVKVSINIFKHLENDEKLIVKKMIAELVKDSDKDVKELAKEF